MEKQIVRETRKEIKDMLDQTGELATMEDIVVYLEAFHGIQEESKAVEIAKSALSLN